MDKDDKILLPHHEQQSLCETRLPYRQGRKLTAVKVYSITKESNHLLIFGVPSLNLRQETKELFIKFGKLLQFNITTQHSSEPFTETYHAHYEKTQPARVAKKMLDTKNFYGGILHVCYAPELETSEETRQKLIQRQRDVVFRLKNLQKVKIEPQTVQIPPSNIVTNETKKLYMGEVNTISLNNEIKVKKRNKKFKPNKESFTSNEESIDTKQTDNVISTNNLTDNTEIDIVDCTNIDNDVITNINDSLNYSTFGNEVIKKVPVKPLNKIQFHINKKS